MKVVMPILTAQEKRVLALLYLSSADMAEVLKVKTNTINSYVDTIRYKFGARNRVELMLLACLVGYPFDYSKLSKDVIFEEEEVQV